jgi:glycine betaine catabolism B
LPPQEGTTLSFQRAANKKDLKEGGLVRVELEGKPIVLAMVQGKVFAMDAVCSHEGGPLEDGSLEGYELKCPWHYALFDVRNAKVSDQTVWATDLHSYAVKVNDASGDILVNPAPGALETSSEDGSLRETKSRPDSYSHLTLRKINRLEGTDISTFEFEGDYPDYKAGQFAFFPLDNIENDGKGPVRHFSLASSPTEGVVIMSTRIRDSPYKQKLSSLEQGAKVRVSRPQGNFVLHEDYSKPAVFLSGGIGVTPFRSMVKYATDKQLQLRITMFDSNRSAQNILYKDEFDLWAAQNKNLKIIYTVTEDPGAGWSGERSRIDRTMLETKLSKDEISNAVFYICGPPGMLNAMQELLRNELRTPAERIRVEEFTGY